MESLLIVKGEEVCCIVPQRDVLAVRRRGAGGRLHDVKGGRGVWLLSMSFQRKMLSGVDSCGKANNLALTKVCCIRIASRPADLMAL